MNHKRITALALLLLTIILSACDSAQAPTKMPIPTAISAEIPLDTPSPTSMATLTESPLDTPLPTLTLTQHLTADEAFKAAEECAHQWENTQRSEDLDCAIYYYQEAIGLLDADDSQQTYYQFRFDRLLWISGQEEVQARERILDFIRKNLDNGEAADFLFEEILPEPQSADIEEGFIIYEDEWMAPHFAISQYGAQVEVGEAHTPGSVYKGDSSLQIKWNKSRDTWASLVIGFDPHIADVDVAGAGGMRSLDLDRFSRDNYRLEFAVRGGPGMDQWGEKVMRIKLQDQNLIFREPIGNQMVCRILLAEEWTTYSIPLGGFVPDPWILEPYADETPTGFGSRPWLEFDWTRVKQINFDVPYWASGSGILWLDNIQLVRADLANGGVESCVER